MQKQLITKRQANLNNDIKAYWYQIDNEYKDWILQTKQVLYKNKAFKGNTNDHDETHFKDNSILVEHLNGQKLLVEFK